MNVELERHEMTELRDRIKDNISIDRHDCKFTHLGDSDKIEVLRLSAEYVYKLVTCHIIGISTDDPAIEINEMIESQSKDLRCRPFKKIDHYYDRYFIANYVLEILMDRLIKKKEI